MLEHIQLIQNGIFVVNLALKPFIDEWDSVSEEKSNEIILKSWMSSSNLLDGLLHQWKVWKTKKWKA